MPQNQLLPSPHTSKNQGIYIMFKRILADKCELTTLCFEWVTQVWRNGVWWVRGLGIGGGGIHSFLAKPGRKQCY